MLDIATGHTKSQVLWMWTSEAKQGSLLLDEAQPGERFIFLRVLPEIGTGIPGVTGGEAPVVVWSW